MTSFREYKRRVAASSRPARPGSAAAGGGGPDGPDAPASAGVPPGGPVDAVPPAGPAPASRYRPAARQGDRAGIVSRALANLLDLAVVAGVVTAGYFGWTALRFMRDPVRFSWPAFSYIPLLVVGGAVLTAYLWLSWAAVGRTWGGQLMGLRVVNFRGERMRPLGALVRAVFCVVFMMGLLWVVVSRQNRSVQDVVLRTSVVYDWSARGDHDHAGPGHP